MTTQKALEVLRHFQAWRRYGGHQSEAPDYPDPKEVGEALDVAIEMLCSLVSKPEREYYGQ